MIELKVIDSELTALEFVMSTGTPIDNQDKTVTPNEEEQSVTADAGYTGLGTVTVEAIDADYIGSAVDRRSAADLMASGPTVTAPAGYYENDASKTTASGTEGTPTAIKGTVSGHAVSVTPRVTNSAGYISGGTKTGSAVTVEASELVSGTKEITANGTDIDVTEYEKVNVAVPGPSGTKNISITQNGTTTENVSGYASAEITANVPNTYSASDEGKVVDNGALVAQTSDTVTQNDTYDTTLINSLTVYVSGGGSDPYHLKSGTDLFVSQSGIDWNSNKAILTSNNLNRNSIVATSGTEAAELYYSNGSAKAGRYLIPIPNGATSVTITVNKTCQFAVREFIETSGAITASIATTGWLDISANVGVNVALNSGTNYIGISLRVSSSNPNFGTGTQVFIASIDFS